MESRLHMHANVHYRTALYIHICSGGKSQQQTHIMHMHPRMLFNIGLQCYPKDCMAQNAKPNTHDQPQPNRLAAFQRNLALLNGITHNLPGTTTGRTVKQQMGEALSFSATCRHELMLEAWRTAPLSSDTVTAGTSKQATQIRMRTPLPRVGRPH